MQGEWAAPHNLLGQYARMHGKIRLSIQQRLMDYPTDARADGPFRLGPPKKSDPPDLAAAEAQLENDFGNWRVPLAAQGPRSTP